jgi:hypothetical protein
MADDLAGLIAELASRMDDVGKASVGDATEYSRGGTVFAVVRANEAELRLLSDIGDAARRTPDTHESERGEDWVHFNPPALDQHAIDRAEAWFLIAYRAASGPPNG